MKIVPGKKTRVYPGGGGYNSGGEGVEELSKFCTDKILGLKFSLQKTLGLTWEGGQNVSPPLPQNTIGLKTSCIILYMLVKFTYQI